MVVNIKKIKDQEVSATTYHPPSTTTINKKIFGVGSEILLKYKKLKWTSSG